MIFIGGVKVDEDLWYFDFNLKLVFDVLLWIGLLLGRDEFQFFLIIGEIGEEVVDILCVYMEMVGKLLLELSIGQVVFVLCILEVNWIGVELLEVNVVVLQVKGFYVELGDFIVWLWVISKCFDGVLMNLFFCDYQVSNYVLVVYSLLWDGGVLVVIMLDGYQLEYFVDNLLEGVCMVKGECY